MFFKTKKQIQELKNRVNELEILLKGIEPVVKDLRIDLKAKYNIGDVLEYKADIGPFYGKPEYEHRISEVVDIKFYLPNRPQYIFANGNRYSEDRIIKICKCK